jgi:hypothetical protein
MAIWHVVPNVYKFMNECFIFQYILRHRYAYLHIDLYILYDILMYINHHVIRNKFHT